MKIFNLLGGVTLLLTAYCAAPAYGETKIEVYLADDADPEFVSEITTGTSLRFSEDQKSMLFMGLPSDVAERSFSLSEIKSIKFKGPWTGICEKERFVSDICLLRNPVENSLELSYEEGVGMSLAVYSVSGSRVAYLPAWNGEAVDVSACAPGLYFISINNKTVKFIKK